MNPWQASSSSRLLELLVLREIIPKAVHSDSVGSLFKPFSLPYSQVFLSRGSGTRVIGVDNERKEGRKEGRSGVLCASEE